SKLFVFASIVGAVAVLALESFVFSVFLTHVKDLDSVQYRAIPTYFALFLFAMIYQVVVSVLAVVSKNKLLILMVIAFYYAMLLYSGIQILEMRKSLFKTTTGLNRAKAACYATIGITAALAVCQTCLAYMVREDYNWYMNKRVTSHPKVQRMFMIWEIHRTLLIFDFFFLVAFGIQFSVIMLNKTSAEFIITIALTPVMVILLFFADFSASREWFAGALISMILYLCGLAYLLFKLIRLYTKYSPNGSYLSGKKSLTTFGVLTILFLIATMVVTGMLMRNFGKGLKEYVTYSWKW
ncbi:hypothetical protein BABINDRAFT_28543, partial [Babjeviella inositovora NRRL Y-12698]